MTNDVRDERLSRLLDAAASRIDVTPHIEPVVQRGSLRRGVRTTAMVAAVAVFVGAVGYGAMRARDTSAPGIDPSTWNEYSNPDGWTSRYPDGWVVQPFKGPVTKIYLSGAFFSNVAYDFHHPDLGPNDFTSGWDLSSFPRDGVAVEFERFVGGPEPIQSGPDTPFPLSLENTPAVQSSSTPESGGQRSIDIVHDGSRYTLNVWFGADASQEDREMARLLITTIAFPGTATVEPSPSKPRTRTAGEGQVTVIPAPVNWEWPPARPVADAGALWMPARTGDAMLRLDTHSFVIETITVPASAVAVGNGLVWVAGVAADGTPTLSSVEPSTRSVASSFPLRAEPRAIAWGDGSVWVAFLDGTVDRVDGDTGTVLATIDLPGQGATELAAAGTSVWANLGGEMEVVRIDAETNSLDGKPIPGRASITADQDALWGTEFGQGELLRVDGRTGTTTTWSIPGSEGPPTAPVGLPAFDGSGGAWVAVARGGTDGFGPDTLWHVSVGDPNPTEVPVPNIANPFVSADGALWFVQRGRIVRYVPPV